MAMISNPFGAGLVIDWSLFFQSLPQNIANIFKNPSGYVIIVIVVIAVVAIFVIRNR